MARTLCESDVEEYVISKLEMFGYQYLNNEDDELCWASSRKLDEFIDEEVLHAQLIKINKGIKLALIDDAIYSIKRISNPMLFERNRIFHEYLVKGIEVETGNEQSNPTIKLIDFDNPENNLFNVANQLKFNEKGQTRIPDVLVFINGLPLIIFELKSPEYREDTFLQNAYDQLGGKGDKDGYRYDIPTLFNYNSFLVISDGANSKVGTLTSDITRYSEWKSVNGEQGYKKNFTRKLDVMLDGMFSKERLLDIIKNYLFFIRNDKEKPVKILAQYHQYFGAIKAYESIKEHKKPSGDGKAGIIWHTQGSGKSYTMLMLAHRLINDTSLNNPTIVVLTDRNDLDNQLKGTFDSAKEFLNTKIKQADSRTDLLDELKDIKVGGIVFTTLQKFDKVNTFTNQRNNIIVFSDEAHRSHYGLDEKIVMKKENKEIIKYISKYGMEKYIRDSLPNATFIGFTGTPVKTRDKMTTAIFGDIVDTYDMTQSIEDGSTVKLYYESRLAKVWLDNDILKEIDHYYDDIVSSNAATEEQVIESQKKLTNIELIVGDIDRLKLLANDIYNHYQGRKNFLNGKAMIVCMSRKIAYNLYKLLLEIDPKLEEDIALVVTDSNKDSEEMRNAFGTKKDRDELARNFKGEGSKKGVHKKKIAIVVDMWLTGFDVPDLDVMYIDKPMQGHNLMQAIARVNRVFPGKESGLIVDYIGLNKPLAKALSDYTARDQKFNLQDVQNIAKSLIDEDMSILDEMLYTVDKNRFFNTDSKSRFQSIQDGAEFVLYNEDRKKDFLKTTRRLKDAFIVAAGILNDEYKTRILYYISVRHYIMKLDYEGYQFNTGEINKHVEELISEAIKGDEIKVLSQVSEDKEKVKIWELLSEDSIEELRKTNPPHIFIKIMQKLLNEAIKEYKQYNLIKSNEYSEKLRLLLDRYNTREDASSINQTILGLVDFSKEMVNDKTTAEKNHLKGREKAFYDALIKEESAIAMMKDGVLYQIAAELKDIVQEYAKVDWSKKRTTQARMRMQIKKLLQKYDYPPEYREGAVERVIKQAEYMM
ncbi:MAG: type I restriction endonuclease subunit R [Clostridia bacterium]|nr:type I restriction endonuclease subunit R [Clostridia bacterium]